MGSSWLLLKLPYRLRQREVQDNESSLSVEDPDSGFPAPGTCLPRGTCIFGKVYTAGSDNRTVLPADRGADYVRVNHCHLLSS